MCSPKDSWHRGRGRGIARTRLRTNPLRMVFTDLEQVTGRQTLAALRTLWIDVPEWELSPELKPVRIGRFTPVVSTKVLGPDGSLVVVIVDGKFSGAPYSPLHTMIQGEGDMAYMSSTGDVNEDEWKSRVVAEVMDGAWYSRPPQWARRLLLEAA